MSGCYSSISARQASQSGRDVASVRGVTGTIRRSSAGGRPSRLRSCRSVVMTSEVLVTRSSLNCSSRCGGLGDVGDGAAADLQLGLLALEDLLGQLDGLLARPELDVLLGQAPVLLLDRADLGHDLGLEPRDVRILVQHARSPFPRRTGRTGGRPAPPARRSHRPSRLARRAGRSGRRSGSLPSYRGRCGSHHGASSSRARGPRPSLPWSAAGGRLRLARSIESRDRQGEHCPGMSHLRPPSLEWDAWQTQPTLRRPPAPVQPSGDTSTRTATGRRCLPATDAPFVEVAPGFSLSTAAPQPTIAVTPILDDL